MSLGVTYGVAAVASDVTQETLRGWLKRKQVELEPEAGPERSRGWRRFTIRDCFQLALVGRLSGFGVPIRMADDFAREILDEVFDGQNGAQPRNLRWTIPEYFKLRKYVESIAAKSAPAFVCFHEGEWHLWSDTSTEVPDSLFAWPFAELGAASWGTILIGTVFLGVLDRFEDIVLSDFVSSLKDDYKGPDGDA